MIGRRAVIGLSLLCALAFCAFSASSASAVTKGTTAFTCVEVVEGQFDSAHCNNKVPGKFEHQAIAEDTEANKFTTHIHITSAKTDPTTTKDTNGVLKATAFGVENEVVCAKTFGHGELANKKDPTGEHYIHVEKVTLHYTECVVNKPAGCKVPGGTILLEGLTATTTEEGDNITFKPEVGETLLTLTYEGCTNPLFNGPHKLNGTFKGQPSGATITFTHATITAEKTLTYGGSVAGLEAKLTISQAEKTAELLKEPGKTGNPISVTTVETP
jgi:hypothetical protein